MGSMWKNVKLFTFFAILFSFTQSLMINGFFPSSVSSLERRYDLTSTQAGFLSSAYDISCVAFGLIVGYVGGKSHRPRALALGSFLLAIAAFAWAVPQSFTRPYKPSRNDSAHELCDVTPSEFTSNCLSRTGQSGAYVIFVFAMILGGFAGTILYVLTPTFLSDNTTKHAFFAHTGFFNAASPLGAAIGYIVAGSVFLNIYVDLGTSRPDGLTPEHPAWVGAWWLQFVVAGCLLLLTSLPLLCFPGRIRRRRLVSVRESIEMIEEREKKSIGEDSKESASTSTQTGRSWNEFWGRLRVVLRNPVLMFAIFGNMFLAIVVGGLNLFLPKFLQQQFSIPASSSSIVAGAATVPSAVLGSVVVGLVAKRIKLSGRGSANGLWIFAVIGVGTVLTFLMVCKTGPIAGSMNSAYNDSGSSKDNLTSSCNVQCSCETETFDPICGIDKFTYFSPCHAGCTKSNATEEDDDDFIYWDCSCIKADERESDEGYLYQAKSGSCDPEGGCPWLIPFCVFTALAIFIIFGGGALYVNVLIRCVAKPDRSLGLGIHRMFSHCGFIVGPILIGAVIDLSCVLWSSNCGRRGSCWVYDNEKMAYYVLIVTEAVFTLAFICFFVSWWCFKKEMEVAIDECDTVHPPSMNNDASTGERKEEEKKKKAWSDDTDQSAMEY
ncbi:solute carrier organic anion transporter family member 4C1-like [Oscarella lobularis]|uniref:solute carrier organic anion transporter family member 4C1-like n=1 Tax=Oscarella lobularis TaxID=121494 RepID=UPI0033130F6C